jgi:hypothetical protein
MERNGAMTVIEVKDANKPELIAIQLTCSQKTTRTAIRRAWPLKNNPDSQLFLDNTHFLRSDES